jgi:predicted RND superfamily exporter protein
MSGFFALMLAVMPLLPNTGFTLGIGIFYSVIVDVFFNPVNVLMVRKSQLYMRNKKEKKLQEKLCDMKAMKESMNNLQE